MSQSHFQKFVPKKKNSLVKEEFKQAKKKAKKERAAAIDKRFEEKRQLKTAARNTVHQSPPRQEPNARPPQSKGGLVNSRREEKMKAIENNFNQVKKIESIKFC